jgi:hypothetical protein
MDGLLGVESEISTQILASPLRSGKEGKHPPFGAPPYHIDQYSAGYKAERPKSAIGNRADFHRPAFGASLPQTEAVSCPHR